MEIKVINHSPFPLPEYATPSSAGLDLRANIAEAITIAPGVWTLVPTGLMMELPEGYEAQIRPRSGLALKNGIGILNAPGTIDADYRGEIKIILMNFSTQPFTIEPGDRIAQMVIAKYEKIHFTLTEQLSETTRGAGGYGHSGV